MDDETAVGGNLQALSIFHYVYAGLSACSSLLGLFYVALGQLLGWAVAQAPKPQHGEAPPPELFQWLFGILGFVVMAVALTIALLSFLSGRAIARRRSRTFSLVVAGILCLTGPIGIALGVFTLVVLLKPEAERLYAAAETR